VLAVLAYLQWHRSRQSLCFGNFARLATFQALPFGERAPRGGAIEEVHNVEFLFKEEHLLEEQLKENW